MVVKMYFILMYYLKFTYIFEQVTKRSFAP